MLRNNGMTQLYTGKSAGKRTVPMPAHACIEQAEANGLKVKYVKSIDQIVDVPTNITDKIKTQMGRRGWTEDSINSTISMELSRLVQSQNARNLITIN